MRKTLLATIATLLIAASSVQIVAAAEAHHARKAHATTSQQFRNANNAVTAPATSSELGVYSRGWSAPAGQ